MYKRIVSSLIMLCLLSNIIPVFGEELLQNNTEYGIINTETLTDENVIYNTMQNTPDIFQISNDVEHSSGITSDFDMVLCFDMSSDMYKYDRNSEFSWIDEFEALEEQAPEGTRFAVLNVENSFSGSMNTNSLKETGYGGSVDAGSVMDKCMNSFDNEQPGRNKIAVITLSKAPEIQDMRDKINEMINYGIIPFVFVLDTESDESVDDIENVYTCKTDLELRLALSELYLALGEFGNAAPLSGETNAAENYVSDFRDRHNFSGTLTNDGTGGILLAEIMNIYGCVPIRAVVEGSLVGYDLVSDGFNDAALQLFLKGDNKSFSLGQESAMVNFKQTWETIFNKAKDHFSVSGDDAEEAVIIKNLKRRFPLVALNNDGEYEVIKDSNYNCDEIETVFDTYEYLMNMLVYGELLSDSSETVISDNNSYVRITIDYPASYDVNGQTLIGGEQRENVMLSMPLADLEKSGNKVSINLTDYQDVIITSVARYNSSGLVNICNPNKRYIARIYVDVTSKSLWYYDYVFEATNRGIIQGYGDDNTFRPEPVDSPFIQDENYGKITRGEFVKMAVVAAGFNFDEESDGTDLGRVWAQPYLEKASEMGLLYDYKYNDFSENIDEEVRYNYQQELLKRKEAAYILLKLFIENEDNTEDNKPQIPSVLYKYDINDPNSEKLISWNNGIFSDVDTDLSDDINRAIFQMYANGIINGYEDGTFRQNNDITRAEVCKIIIKSMFDIDNNVELIQANVYGEEYPVIDTGIEKTGTLGSDGNAIYEVVVDKDGRYIDYTNGTYSSEGRLYQISIKGDGVQYELMWKNGVLVPAVTGESGQKYRLKTNERLLLKVTGSPNTEFSVTINDCWSDTKKNYIVVYDSYDNQFQEVLGSGVTSRYRDETGGNYEYSKEFFKNYFEVLGNRRASFVIALRDLYADGTTQYTTQETPTGTAYIKTDNMLGLSDIYIGSDFMNNVVSITSERYNNIIDYMESALDELNEERTEQIPFPEIYLASPHFMYSAVSDADGGIDTENNLVTYYTEISKRIYNNVALEQGADKITGMDFGKEDPHNMDRSSIVSGDTSGEFSMTYKAMRALSSFLHDNGKKLLWIPYSTSGEEWENIGEIVNTGVDEKNRGILDVFMMQPGLFYSDYNEGFISDDPRMQKQYWLRNSVIQGKFVDGNGNTIGGEKSTNTDIAFQIEFDISLVTGRNYNDISPKEADDRILMNTFPQQAAENFIKTYKWYHDLITDEETSMGMYIGGPGEQDYGNSEGNNGSLHSRVNHPSALSVRVSDNGYTEIGEGMAFNDFFERIKEENSNAYNKDYYDNRLIADITTGLLYNDWSEDVKEYLNMEANMNKFPLPENYVN